MKKRKQKKYFWKRSFQVSDPNTSKILYQYLLGGFAVWFIVLFFVFQGMLADILSTPAVPDWVIPYDKEIARRVREMTQGYPIERMNEYIARFDEKTAAYLVSIAKKESDWGRRIPVSHGKDCYNYWGFRDPDNTRGSDGHSCFESPEQAVRIVGKRVRQLVYEYKRDTPKELSVWKCGRACAYDAGAQKWVSDVSWYYNKFLDR